MTRRRRVLFALLAVAAVATATVVVGARVFVPPWLHDTLERLVTEQLGRELKIAGTFRLAYSLEPAVVAEDVTLANATWGSEPAMVRVDRVEIALDLASLAKPPIRIRNVELDGVRVLLERDPEGRGNWEFDLEPGPPGPKPDRPLIVDRAAVREFEIIFRRPPSEAPLRFGVKRLEGRLDAASDMVHLDAEGHFNDAPWDVAGTLGTLDRLYALRDVSHDVRGRIGSSRIALRGRIRDPLSLGDPEVEAEIEGPDLAAALAVAGLRSPISGAYHVRARLSPSEGGADVDVEAGVAGVTATGRGRVGALLGMDPVAAKVRVAGPDASVVGGWFGVAGIPPAPFELGGDLRRDGARVAIEGVAGTLAGIAVEARGEVPDDLAFTARGSDLSRLSALTRLDLPSGAFDARGRFLRRGDALVVENVEARTQGAVLKASGTVGMPPRLDVAFDASGSDLSRFSKLATVELPARPFEARGRVFRDGDAFALEGIEGRVGDDVVRGSGRLVPAKRLVGSTFEARVAGPDLAATAALFGLNGLAPGPWEAAGAARFVPEGFRFDSVEAKAGGLSARGGGRIGDVIEVDGAVEGSSLVDLAAWGVKATLPGDPFRASGRIQVVDRVVRVDRATAAIGADRVDLDGTLGTFPDLPQLDVVVGASGPRLVDLARFLIAVGHEVPERLPPEPYTASARVRRTPEGPEILDGRATVGDAEVRVDGVVGRELHAEARAPSPAIVEELAGVELPPGALEVRGRIGALEPGIRVHDVRASIGENHASVAGTIGGGEVDVEIDVEGPDLAALLEPLTGLALFPAEPFVLSAHLEGDRRRVASRRFSATLGDNDLEGSLSVELGDRRTVEADLRSRRLDLRKVVERFAADSEPSSGPKAKKKERLFPIEPIGLDAIRNVDATIRFAAAEVELPGFLFNDVIVEGSTREGAARVDRLEGSGAYGGRVSARLSLDPGAEGYRLRAEGRLVDARVAPVATEVPPEQSPGLDANFEIEGAGRSLHEIAASSRGGGLATLGAGRLPSGASDVVTSGMFRSLLDTLNPFRKSSRYTEVECAVLVADVVSGKATVEPVAARTDKLTIVGSGKIDLDTEKIDFSWTLKPRRGVGISAASLTNPYIKLGGTLASPSIDAKPLDAAASTGAAVATAGLTLLARGLYDRITAEKKVCLRALEEAEKKAAKRAAARQAEAP